MQVGDALARAELELLELARGEDGVQFGLRQCAQRRAHVLVAPAGEPQARAVLVAQHQEAPQVLLLLRPAADAEEVDDLDEEPRRRRRCARARRATSSRRPGTKRSSPMRSSGPLGTSRMPVASTTSTPGRPSAKRPYQSRIAGVTNPSSTDRQGTIAGTQLRARATQAP